MRPTNPRPLALFVGTVLAGVLAVVALAETNSWWVMGAAIAMISLLGLAMMVDIWNASPGDRTAPAAGPSDEVPEQPSHDEPGPGYLGPVARRRVLVVTSEPVAAGTILADRTADKARAVATDMRYGAPLSPTVDVTAATTRTSLMLASC